MIEEALLIDALRQTARCRTEVVKTEELFAGFSQNDYESLIMKLIEEGEDKALGILLNICALKRIKLEPCLLADTLKVVYDISDFSYPYRDQDREAIDPLLDVAMAEDISLERQAYAARLATELSIIFNEKQNETKKILLKLSNRFRPHDIGAILIDESLSLLNKEKNNDLLRITHLDVLEELPDGKPPVVTGGFYTVRRPVPKIGRNSPCPCGSGKKYKKCCYEKDQELLRDASPYEGVTMTQAQSSPGIIDSTDMIEEMRAYQLKKLIPSELNDKQLLAAYRRADIFGLRELAFTMLLELKDRPGKDEFAIGQIQDLLWSTLNADELELAKKIEQHIPSDELYIDESVQFHRELLENREWFAGLEERCRQALTGEKDEFIFKHPLVDLGFNFENLFPALSIIFSRAAIMNNPENFFDNKMLLEAIRNGRTDLDLDPWGDPIEDYLDWANEKIGNDFELEEKGKELELNSLIKRVEKERESKPVPIMITDNTPLKKDDSEVRDNVLQLKLRIEHLKMEIKAQQHERKKLRDQLQDKREKSRAQKIVPSPGEPETEDPPEFEKSPKIIPIPEYTDTFISSCGVMPPAIVSRALRAVAGFAAQSQEIRNQSRRLERMPDVYRVRIGLQHRLMIRWEKGTRLEVLDLINRQSLETWIKRHTR